MPDGIDDGVVTTGRRAMYHFRDCSSTLVLFSDAVRREPVYEIPGATFNRRLDLTPALRGMRVNVKSGVCEARCNQAASGGMAA